MQNLTHARINIFVLIVVDVKGWTWTAFQMWIDVEGWLSPDCCAANVSQKNIFLKKPNVNEKEEENSKRDKEDKMGCEKGIEEMGTECWDDEM